jgi:hypothetical protein
VRVLWAWAGSVNVPQDSRVYGGSTFTSSQADVFPRSDSNIVVRALFEYQGTSETELDIQEVSRQEQHSFSTLLSLSLFTLTCDCLAVSPR